MSALDPGPVANRWPAAPALTPGARAIVAGAIRLLEHEGWVQGTEYVPGRGYCATGALRHASGADPLGGLEAGSASDLALARMALRARVGVIPIWNDSLTPGVLGAAIVVAELRALLGDDGPQR